MSEIKTVALAGASGELGQVVLRELLAAGFPVTVLVRAPGKLPAELASHPSLKEVTVEYTSPSSLQSALSGLDAVVSALGTQSGTAQRALVEAAEAAAIKRFLPSEFGSDLDNAETRGLPVFADKVAIQDYLKQRVTAGSKLTYTFVYNNAFLDWGLQKNFLLDVIGHNATLWDGGDFPISVARLSTVAKAVVGVLRHPEETKNRAVYIHDGRVSVKRLLEIAKEATPGNEWVVKEESTVETAKKSYEGLGKGVHDSWVWVGFIYRASQAKETGAGFGKVDNELLGIKTLCDAELKEEIVKTLKEIPGAA